MRDKITLACTECKQRNYDTKKNKIINLQKGDFVYIIEDNFLTNTYTISFNDIVGTISKSNLLRYSYNNSEKLSLMIDVSKYNLDGAFKKSRRF